MQDIWDATPLWVMTQIENYWPIVLGVKQFGQHLQLIDGTGFLFLFLFYNMSCLFVMASFQYTVTSFKMFLYVCMFNIQNLEGFCNAFLKCFSLYTSVPKFLPLLFAPIPNSLQSIYFVCLFVCLVYRMNH